MELDSGTVSKERIGLDETRGMDDFLRLSLSSCLIFGSQVDHLYKFLFALLKLAGEPCNC